MRVTASWYKSSLKDLPGVGINHKVEEDPGFEFDAFATCQAQTAPAVERTCKVEMASNEDSPNSHFDAGNFQHLLKLAAGDAHLKRRKPGLRAPCSRQ